MDSLDAFLAMRIFFWRLKKIGDDTDNLNRWNEVVARNFSEALNDTDFEWLQRALIPHIEAYPWPAHPALPPVFGAANNLPIQFGLRYLPDAMRPEAERRANEQQLSLRRNFEMRPRFIGPLDVDDVCPICHDALSDVQPEPIQVSCCRQIFCRACLVSWYDVDPPGAGATACPLCRVEQVAEPVVDPSPESGTADNAETPWWVKMLRNDDNMHGEREA
ncbi:hypothetical protein BP6252_12694 [Coleophoma cylindrospora]|uniref:RING-type domain-containing protein n=1 Tax=Coleophoma cylindrospora TaxID=1849047 RepID=A0A3D8QD13_9HELO|nr:hypothetical protein BP6252_12694 [Coleophoma cylindrospora]